MSWSMNAKGTAEACKRVLAGQKVYSPAEGEQEVFDFVRASLFALLDKGGYTDVPSDSTTLFELSASGHGKRVAVSSFKCEIVYLK